MKRTSSSPVRTRLMDIQAFEERKYLKKLYNFKKSEHMELKMFQFQRIGKEKAIWMENHYLSNPLITELRLNQVSLLNDEAYDLVYFLEKNTTITSLKLLSPSINTAGFSIIAQALKTNTTLQKIKFSDNVNRENVSPSIAEIIKFNKTLTDLNFTNLHIDDDGIKVISEALAINTSLSKINLSNNIYSNNSANYLASSLESNRTIKHINLRLNLMGIEGYEILLKKLVNNISLTTISLDEVNPALLISEEFVNTNERFQKHLTLPQGEYFKIYENIQSICHRNKEKEILIERAIPIIKLLALETPTEIANLISEQLLTTEHDAATLRRIGNLV
jgi:hypothetical protein